MPKLPPAVAGFLAGKRIAVAGVSRQAKGHVGNAIFRKFAAAGYEVFPVNPRASEVEGVKSYPAVSAIPGDIDGVVVATRPESAACVIRQCADKGVKRVWFHRSFGQGSASDKAIADAKAAGIDVIENGCPMMYIAPVDPAHMALCSVLKLFGRVPK